MKKIILPFFLSMLFVCTGKLLFSQNHCCNKKTGQCLPANNQADCDKSGADFVLGAGPCTIDRCNKCCTVGAPAGPGCVENITNADCLKYGRGAYSLGTPPTAVCSTCDTQGKCCIYRDFVLDDSLQLSIISCGGWASVFNEVHWVRANQQCPANQPPPPTAILITSTVEFLESRYDDVQENVQLSWKINSQIKYRGFYIERSRDGSNFKTIGFADQNSSPQVGVYDFADINPLNVGYYRLLSVYEDGSLTTSQVVNIISLKKGVMLLMPNPATNRMSVLLGNMQLSNTEISVSDMWGREVLKQTLTKGEHSINVSNLPRGSYAVRALQNGNVFTARFVKN